MTSVAGPTTRPNRRLLDQINDTDAALATSYGLFFLVLGAVLGVKAHIFGWMAAALWFRSIAGTLNVLQAFEAMHMSGKAASVVVQAICNRSATLVLKNVLSAR